MNCKHWAACAVLAIVFANTGCVSCCNKSYAKAWTNGPECELPQDCRGNVYVFMVHGGVPCTDGGLGTLRDKLAESGFAKVGIGDITSIPCIVSEIKCIAKCEPDARFVLVGYDLGGAAAVCLARDLGGKGIPIDAVVLLDPRACGDTCTAQTLLILSGKTTSTVPHTDRVVVPDATHHKLPSHPETIAAITGLLSDIATRNYQPVTTEIGEWQYPHAPAMRPIPLAKGGSWDFLADTGAPPSPIGTRVETKPAATAEPTRPSTSAGAVIVPKQK
jgi:pimeloyl-ACP methyl ester carboxylesterase